MHPSPRTRNRAATLWAAAYFLAAALLALLTGCTASRPDAGPVKPHVFGVSDARVKHQEPYGSRLR